jgi:hypothetical protein
VMSVWGVDVEMGTLFPQAESIAMKTSNTKLRCNFMKVPYERYRSNWGVVKAQLSSYMRCVYVRVEYVLSPLSAVLFLIHQFLEAFR